MDDDPRGAEAGVDLGDDRRQQAVVRHGEEDPGLAQEHHQHHRAEAGDGAQLDDPGKPGHVDGVDGDRDRIGNVELPVADDARHHDCAPM